MGQVTRKAVVSGRVQGVWYRGSTQAQAQQRSIVGRAVNLPDGTVEVVMTGEAAELDGFIEWLRIGPPLARVDQVKVTELALEPFATFTTG